MFCYSCWLCDEAFPAVGRACKHTAAVIETHNNAAVFAFIPHVPTNCSHVAHTCATTRLPVFVSSPVRQKRHRNAYHLSEERPAAFPSSEPGQICYTYASHEPFHHKRLSVLLFLPHNHLCSSSKLQLFIPRDAAALQRTERLLDVIPK